MHDLSQLPCRTSSFVRVQHVFLRRSCSQKATNRTEEGPQKASGKRPCCAAHHHRPNRPSEGIQRPLPNDRKKWDDLSYLTQCARKGREKERNKFPTKIQDTGRQAKKSRQTQTHGQDRRQCWWSQHTTVLVYYTATNTPQGLQPVRHKPRPPPAAFHSPTYDHHQVSSRRAASLPPAGPAKVAGKYHFDPV